MKGILGKKIGMTQLFTENEVIPVTIVKAGPCVVTQVKTEETDGYHALQLGLLEKTKEKHINSPARGHLKKSGNPSVKKTQELRLQEAPGQAAGDQFDVTIFSENEYVDITGKSKGKGFQGVIKRHGFGGGRATHGSMFHRAPGSIGASAWPSRVWKGTRMGGRMGGKRTTVKNLKIVKIDAENHLLYIKGAVPGSRQDYLFIKTARRGSR